MSAQLLACAQDSARLSPLRTANVVCRQLVKNLTYVHVFGNVMCVCVFD